MSQSPTSSKVRQALLELRDLLRTEAAPAKPDGWLAGAREIRVGLHAEERSFLASGIYLVPASDAPNDYETNLVEHPLEIVIAFQVKGLKGDGSETDPATFVLTDMVFGVLDIIQRQRTIATDGVLLFDRTPGRSVIFESVPLATGGYAYRAEVHVTALLETPT